MGWLDGKDAKAKQEAAEKLLKMIPESLRTKSPEEIEALLKEAPDLKVKVSQLETKDAENTAAVTKIQTEFESVKARLLAAEANRNPNPPPNREEPADFIDEPDKAFSQRLAPFANITIQNAAITARMLAQQTLDNQDMGNGGKTKDGRLFRAWSVEMDVEAKKYPTHNLTNVEAWIGMYLLIKGRHADELADPEARKKNYSFLEPGTTNIQPPPDEKKKDELSPEEIAVAGKMGVKPEDYLKRKKAMQFVNA